MLKLDEVKTVKLTYEEVIDLMEGADIPMPPLSINNNQEAQKPHATMRVAVNGKSVVVTINVFDDDAQTAWWYNLTTRRYAHCGYGPQCCWTEEEDIDEE